MGCILPMMHCRSQHYWELLHPFAHNCQHARNNSQHCWPNNVGSCCVRLHAALVTCFMEEISYLFLFTLILTATHFHLALVACSISYFLTAATKLSCCSSNKKMSPFLFISHSKSLSPLFSLDFAGLPPSFFFVSIFLLLYFPKLWT